MKGDDHMSTLLKLKNIEKTYTSRGAQPVRALTNISFTVEAGEFVAIMGESGSGKSTLLNLIATLDDPTGGDISLNGQDLRTCLVSFKNYLQEGQYNHLKTAVKGTFTVFPKSPTFV
ncbi:ATP-binding cassette domain-containing protein [Lacticaseibacillus paracasei]|uniref:ATP-binding cassette domain-containing protein n=1 Tax=Lacticaseibacillus paracasei TaxID=1597 RepID=UPI0036D2A85C